MSTKKANKYAKGGFTKGLGLTTTKRLPTSHDDKDTPATLALKKQRGRRPVIR